MATNKQSGDSANVAERRATQQQSEDLANFAERRATQQQSEDLSNVAERRATQQQSEDLADVAERRATQQQSEDSANVAERRATQQQSEDSANVAERSAKQQHSENSANVADRIATQQQSEDRLYATGVNLCAQLRRSSVKRQNLPIETTASASKKANYSRFSSSVSVFEPHSPSIDSGIIPVTSSAGTYPMVYSPTGADIYTSANSANTLLYTRVPDQIEFNTITSQDPPEHHSDTHFTDKSVESEHMSMFLNVNDSSGSTVKLLQYSEKRMTEIGEYFRDLLSEYNFTIVGSTAEGLRDCKSDKDVIMFTSKHVVIESENETYDCSDPEIVVIRIPDEGHPGYSKLRVQGVMSIGSYQLVRVPLKYTVKRDGIFYLKNSVKELIRSVVEPYADFSINGPAFHTETNDQLIRKLFQGNGMAPLYDTKHDSLEDIVYCIKSTKWPVEASEWIRRTRASNWPTKELFDNIINAGYYLAAVGSKESKDNEIQWRVSFNKAELLIIESFNKTQIHCIQLLKIMKNNRLSEIAGNNITSYTMKTVMFWCLEEKSDEFWQSSNLMFCFCFCVSKLKSFVKERFIPNYFIRDRNQFIASEFTSEIQKKTCQYLDRFLLNPKHGISMLLPLYEHLANYSRNKLQLISMNLFIRNWLETRISTTQENFLVNRDFLWRLYDGYNIQNILFQCEMALLKLETIIYTQPLIKNLQNYMGFMQYILLREEKKPAEQRTVTDGRNKYSKLMKLSESGDLTHNTLRIATCYLDDGVQEECINIIRMVTESGEYFFVQTYWERLKQTLHCDIDRLTEREHDDFDISLYHRIIYDIDLIDQDPYRTTDEFEQLREKGHVLIGHDSFNLAWKQCYFDVTFMLAEIPVLPKPAALELCIDHSQKHVSFPPFLYGLLLEFLWHQKYGSGHEQKESVLENMKKCITKLPDEQKSRGLNFMTYCCSLQQDYCSASRNLIQSFRLNPVTQNVAHLYMTYIAKLLLEEQFRLCLLDFIMYHQIEISVFIKSNN